MAAALGGKRGAFKHAGALLGETPQPAWHRCGGPVFTKNKASVNSHSGSL
jgi:hypothetical protein